ncbi:HNH endonuclease [Gloeocapsa sp. PCC 73106]|uniref:HNH endonuclease n=1 Tax=Gloeocapsa sp. PCC 73106 TaxID=102232 RepID=UPI0002AC2318|nr:HNH endonuclease [Gloeocapsa sp. PCC 73106]ELR96481.1 restriction endonuclease [Gloeocapsa sp. PCC 73106]
MLDKTTRQLVRKRANFLCEYCHSPEAASAALFEIDHIQPRSYGGSNEQDNLALACQRCNGYRYNFTTGVDPETQAELNLFNPRRQFWREHFIWTIDALRIIGVTPTGRATCARIDLNDDYHNDGFIIKARQFWCQGGWHPPKTDPKLR